MRSPSILFSKHLPALLFAADKWRGLGAELALGWDARSGAGVAAASSLPEMQERPSAARLRTLSATNPPKSRKSPESSGTETKFYNPNRAVICDNVCSSTAKAGEV